jgi:hypothetical protein
MNRTTSFALLAGLLFALVPGSAEAEPILVADGGTLVANGGQAPGSATDYTFFGGIQPTNLTNFVVTLTPGDSQYDGHDDGSGPYTTVIAPGGSTAFQTGIANAPAAGAQTAEIASFQTTFAGNFNIWILDGNTNGHIVGNASVGLNVDGGAVLSTNTILVGGNEFTEYTVTGTTTSDVFGVFATTTASNFPSIGGLTFTASPSAVPEPSSLAMCGLAGAIGSAYAWRRRKRIA